MMEQGTFIEINLIMDENVVSGQGVNLCLLSVSIESKEHYFISVLYTLSSAFSPVNSSRPLRTVVWLFMLSEVDCSEVSPELLSLSIV